MWQPSADIHTLQQRAKLIQQIRQFFYQRDVMEVDTPSLSKASVTDEHLHSFATRFVGQGYAEGLPLYLQTSPEYAMKRLLAAGSGAIFQICKAFRNEENGRHHNPEFTMLEWYRPGFDEFDLMAEIDELMQQLLDCEKAQYISYQQVFIQVLGVDPLTASLRELKQLASTHGFADIAANEEDADTLLQLLFCMVIEPTIGQQQPCFVYHFPASQAALARLHEQDPRVAGRFELYYQGQELANGFNELTDANEQRQRFANDNNKRIAKGLEPVALDENLLAALDAGLPQCAGVALGVDRLVMIACGKKHIREVLSFDIERA
ncbi:elongation factor P--(R)-beta-lysine ligase [Pseudoalteromonas sp. Cnat2-41]|uniref:elongation factor P--(R)-beta-lysine ligase n=1 Tax=unclassified Pseudoalteromonas TaxID=194690 RepID=UPI001EF79B28|nr:MULTISPECIES: elongation factor P--(R)-beta-lysine ligase [unclassified Pseudoalteromonas]MCF2862027.1 elongation factor P--(R)-beta-lysine ligase [Pseudoalteromonas sp. CNAT2-18]MCG7558204.1 elongation factor P--(R)-beta-lysine ligase [Pseudoalteromonas sp. CNAT2-18.1]